MSSISIAALMDNNFILISRRNIQNFLEIVIYVGRESFFLNSLFLVTFLSLLLLFFSFLLIFSKIERKTTIRLVSLFIVYVCMAFPVLYTVYGEWKSPSLTTNIGLGMSFLFTWVLTAIIFIFSIFFRFKEDEEDIYLL